MKSTFFNTNQSTTENSIEDGSKVVQVRNNWREIEGGGAGGRRRRRRTTATAPKLTAQSRTKLTH